MTLRNRFEEDFKLATYIYRIKDKFTENKVISRLKSSHGPMQVSDRPSYSVDNSSSKDIAKQSPPSSDPPVRLFLSYLPTYFLVVSLGAWTYK